LKSKLEQLELDYGSIVDLHSQLKHGQPGEVAALVNRIRAEDPLESRAPLDPDSITSDTLSHVDGPESSGDVASEANWESFNTPSTPFGELPRNQFSPNPFYAGMPDNIPIDPALGSLDPQLSQYGQPSPSNFVAQNLAIPTPFNQNPNLNLNMYNTPVSNSDAPISARHFFQTQTPSMLRSNVSNVRQGMAIQSRSMPEECTAYSESQVESLISAVEMHQDHEIPRASLCELSSIAAVAAQYLRGHLQPGVVEFFYGKSSWTKCVNLLQLTSSILDSSKHFFEDCMQSPIPHLVPLKVCAMLALANILSKSFLAFVYIGKSCDPLKVKREYS
jgi:hypothetical protein